EVVEILVVQVINARHPIQPIADGDQVELLAEGFAVVVPIEQQVEIGREKAGEIGRHQIAGQPVSVESLLLFELLPAGQRRGGETPGSLPLEGEGQALVVEGESARVVLGELPGIRVGVVDVFLGGTVVVGIVPIAAQAGADAVADIPGRGEVAGERIRVVQLVAVQGAAPDLGETVALPLAHRA
ncbi:hypothetical protein AC249_AIPGENE8420, partial [Exaiptasia diaphana]